MRATATTRYIHPFHSQYPVQTRAQTYLLFFQAIGIQPDSNTIALTTKLPKQSNKPAKQYQTSSFNASTPSRKLYKSVVSSTAKKGYRSDLRAEAVARSSAVRQSQRENKKDYEKKLRGAKARKAAELKESSS